MASDINTTDRENNGIRQLVKSWTSR